MRKRVARIYPVHRVVIYDTLRRPCGQLQRIHVRKRTYYGHKLIGFYYYFRGRLEYRLRDGR